VGYHPDADHRAADTEGRHHRISDAIGQSIGAGLVRQSWRNFAFTPLANLCGIPRSRCRWRSTENGLPLGIQAHARQANDGLLLQLAAQIERAIGGKWNSGGQPEVHVTNG
jgi:Asp-tRNA(Asn)/Glu-tRNA(Gln) amidotransferase A subunit family amidase